MRRDNHVPSMLNKRPRRRKNLGDSSDSSMQRRLRLGFTLVEPLVVIAIIGVVLRQVRLAILGQLSALQVETKPTQITQLAEGTSNALMVGEKRLHLDACEVRPFTELLIDWRSFRDLGHQSDGNVPIAELGN